MCSPSMSPYIPAVDGMYLLRLAYVVMLLITPQTLYTVMTMKRCEVLIVRVTFPSIRMLPKTMLPKCFRRPAEYEFCDVLRDVTGHLNKIIKFTSWLRCMLFRMFFSVCNPVETILRCSMRYNVKMLATSQISGAFQVITWYFTTKVIERVP